MTIIEIDRCDYETQPEIESNQCFGCIAETNTPLCIKLSSNIQCSANRIIWIKHKKDTSSLDKNVTVEEVIAAAAIIFDLPGMEFLDSINKIKEVMRMNKDPEYKEYQRLKNKFEGIL
jgi:hypothetical protein